MITYTEENLIQDAQCIWENIKSVGKTYENVFPVPRGGYYFGIAIASLLGVPLVAGKDISEKTLIVDDVIDSGKTRMRFPKNDFACIHMKDESESESEVVFNEKHTFYVYGTFEWIHYFWEGQNSYSSIDDAVIRQLQYIGEDIQREGLLETPKRVVKSWDFLFKGYKETPENLITVFDAEGYDEIVLLKDIEMYSMCEHHLLPFIGKAHIAYIPNQKVIGVSKLARILDMYARRAQIQERIGNQVTEFLMEKLQPKAAACIIEAQHLCMLMRGVQKQNSKMITSSLKGAFYENIKAREELMCLIRG
jgi:GTP cyclohydrolase I